jgi:hypothetical protein
MFIVPSVGVCGGRLAPAVRWGLKSVKVACFDVIDLIIRKRQEKKIPTRAGRYDFDTGNIGLLMAVEHNPDMADLRRLGYGQTVEGECFRTHGGIPLGVAKQQQAA